MVIIYFFEDKAIILFRVGLWNEKEAYRDVGKGPNHKKWIKKQRKNSLENQQEIIN